MKNELNWLLAIVFCAGVFTACTSEDDNAVRPATPVVEVDINETNFPDENFRRFLLEQDYGKDGMLTSAEIASITVMDIAKKDIESLKGIEFSRHWTHWIVSTTIWTYSTFPRMWH